MRIALVHNAINAHEAPDEQDVLVQAQAVVDALAQSGHETVRLTCDLDLADVRDRIRAQAPDLIFNLVESLEGTGRLLHLFPAILDAMGLPYTGAPAEALFMTSNKLLAKSRLRDGGVPTPIWFERRNGQRPEDFSRTETTKPQWIIKSVWEHASIGLNDDALVDGARTAALPELLAHRAPLLGGDCFAENFIAGREFNLSILDGPDGPQVLPPAEIIFEGYDDGKPCIVDYAAKWDNGSYGYHHTPRTFDFSEGDADLLARLSALALDCWHLFHLKGYARVDFRVDAANRPWVLEINANPCISPDAGFAAAVARAGLTFAQAVERIVAAALR